MRTEPSTSHKRYLALPMEKKSSNDDTESLIHVGYWTRVIHRYFPPYFDDIPRGKDDDLSYPEASNLLAQVIADTCCLEQAEDYRAFVHFLANHVRPTLLEKMPRTSNAWYLLDTCDILNVDIVAGNTLLASLRVGGSRGHFPLKVDFNNYELVRSFMFNRIEQNSHLWFAIRPWLIGGSSLDGIFGMNNYEAAEGVSPRQQASNQLLEHLGLRKGEDFKTKKHLLLNGHTFEGLGRDLCARLTGEEIVERGTGVSPYNCAFSHSPDGLIYGPDGKLKAMIEVKCHSGNMSTSYKTIPPVYIPQCVQGMIIHDVPLCYFVSCRYRPKTALGGRYAYLTIEKLHRKSKVDAWFLDVLDLYTRDLRAGNTELSDEFWEQQGRSEKMFAELVREPLCAFYQVDGCAIVQKNVDLDLLLGTQQRLYWSQQPLYLTNEEVERERKARLDALCRVD